MLIILILGMNIGGNSLVDAICGFSPSFGESIRLFVQLEQNYFHLQHI